MTPAPVRVGQAGLGNWGQNLARNFGELADLVWLCDTSQDLRWSVGGALRLDAYFGYYVPGTFEIGYAHGLIQGGIDETWFLLTGSL